MNYVVERLRCESRHVMELAAIDGQIGHPGVKGRFRELLLNNLLTPWLPSGMACGTGVIVDSEQVTVDAGQEDIVVIDSMLSPAIFASPTSTHAVCFYDSVLCRIEVKSTLQKKDLLVFAESSLRLSQLRLAPRTDVDRQVAGAMNILISYSSEIAHGKELQSLVDAMRELSIDPTSGVVSALCIADRGFWTLGARGDLRQWKSLRMSDAGDPLAYFIGFVSNTCFDQRAARQGITPVGGGIGIHMDHPFDFTE